MTTETQPNQIHRIGQNGQPEILLFHVRDHDQEYISVEQHNGHTTEIISVALDQLDGLVDALREAQAYYRSVPKGLDPGPAQLSFDLEGS